MELLINRIVESIVLPPGGLLVLLVIGLLFTKRNPVFARVAVWSAVFGLYMVSTPFFVHQVMKVLESHPPLDISTVSGGGAQAIVVLSANGYPRAPEYGRDTIGGSTLARLRYGAYVHRHTGLPLLVTGGTVLTDDVDTLAKMMADVLVEAFGVDDVWLEPQSSTTWENALFSYAMLTEQGINKVILVTHAVHMRRAVEAFEHVGFEVVPAPTMYVAVDAPAPWIQQWLPSYDAAAATAAAAHEVLGLLWYRMRYY